MDEETLRSVLEFKRNYCYYRRHINVAHDGKPGRPDNNYNITLSSLFRERKLRTNFPAVYYLDFSLLPNFYLGVEYAEEIAGSTDPLIRSVVDYQPLVEAFDNTLPNNQNLWYVFAYSHLNPVYSFRVSYLGGFETYPQEIENRIKRKIVKILHDSEEFLWYYDIIVNQRFLRKVYVDPRSQYSLFSLFAIFGEYFLGSFVNTNKSAVLEKNGLEVPVYMIDPFDPTLPQIKLRMLSRPDYTRYSYRSLVEFLKEEKTRRRL